MEIVDHDAASTVGSEMQSDLPADPLSCAGDEGDALFEVENIGHMRSFPIVIDFVYNLFTLQ
jgi:hypothetical protein